MCPAVDQWAEFLRLERIARPVDLGVVQFEEGLLNLVVHRALFLAGGYVHDAILIKGRAKIELLAVDAAGIDEGQRRVAFPLVVDLVGRVGFRFLLLPVGEDT